MELTMAESVAEPPPEAEPIQFVWEDGNGQRTALINNLPSGSLSVRNLRGGRVTVPGVTEETILPGTTKGP